MDDTGLEPVTSGLQNQRSKNTSSDKTKTCKSTKEQLIPKSEKQGKIDTQNLPSDLAEIVAVWPRLPKDIQSAILTLIRTTSGTT